MSRRRSGVSRRHSRRMMRQLGLRRGRGLRIIAFLVVAGLLITGVAWVWEAWNRSMHPATQDVDMALMFLAGAVVALLTGETLAMGRRQPDDPKERPGVLSSSVGLLPPIVAVLALWAGIGWLPWNAHYGLPALGAMLLIPATGWSIASQIASYRRATAPLGEVVEPVARHSIVPITGALAGVAAWTALTLTWGSPGIVALIGWSLLTATTAAGLLAGAVIAHEHAGDENLAGQLAATLGVPDATLAGMRWWIDRQKRVHVRGPLPGTAISNLPDLADRIVTRMPTHEVAEASADGVLLTPVTQSTIAARELLESTDRYVLSEIEIPDPPPHRPDARLWELSEKARVAAGPAVDVQARKRGWSVVEYSPEAHSAVVAALDPETRLIRDRVADALHAKPWDIELLVTYAEGHIETVEILRTPVIQPTKRRLDTWREIIASVIPDGSAGWEIEDRPVLGELTLRWGPVPELPKLVAGVDLLPPEIGGDWAQLPIGVAEDGTAISLDLKAGPHSLIVGGTGSGKSTAVRMAIMAALGRGFEVIIIDPTKRAAGLKNFRPWLKAIVTKDTKEAARALEAVYDEVMRRVDLIEKVQLPDDEEAEDWTHLPAGTVSPWLVIIDEFGSLVDPDSKPKGLERGDPALIQWEVETTAKARIFQYVEKMAQQARSAGVHLVISTQRPDAEDLGGKTRDNLGTKIQLVPPKTPPSADALRMVFSKEYSASAGEQMTLLNDGKSRGFALSHIEGGQVQGFRVGLVEPREVRGIAEGWGVPEGIPLEIPEPDDDLDLRDEPVGGRERARQNRSKRKAGADAMAEFRAMQAKNAAKGAGDLFGGEPAEPWLSATPAWDYSDEEPPLPPESPFEEEAARG